MIKAYFTTTEIAHTCRDKRSGPKYSLYRTTGTRYMENRAQLVNIKPLMAKYSLNGAVSIKK